MALISMNKYAKHRGVTIQAVSKAVKAGRITCKFNEKGHAEIDPEVADREWEENSDHSKFRGSNENSEKAASHNKYSTALKAYQARLAKLEFEEKSGRLHDVEQCKRDAFSTARAARDALMGIPDRLAPELVGQTDVFAIRKRLEEELRQALEAIASVIDKQ